MGRAFRRIIPASVAVTSLVASLAVLGAQPAAGTITDCDEIPNTIEAADLIQLQLPGGCYWVGKMITDEGIGARVQAPGGGVYTQSHGSRRARELSVETLEDGALQLAYVGDVVGAEVLEEPPLPPIPGLPEDPDLPLPDPGLTLPDTEITVPDPGLTVPDTEITVPDPELPELPEVPQLRLRTPLREPCSGCLPPCDDDANFVVGYKEFGSYKWKLNRGSVPKSLGRRKVTRIVKRAFVSVRDAFNDCKLSESLSTQGAFDGKTTKRGNFDREGRCKDPDGTNVVDFGPLPTAGLTCSWFRSRDGYNEHVESDVRMSKTQRWTLSPGPSCSRRLDLRGLVTHEIGHVYGLGHVGESSKNLTMTERIPLCSTKPRTLGLGDIRGLRALY